MSFHISIYINNRFNVFYQLLIDYTQKKKYNVKLFYI